MNEGRLAPFVVVEGIDGCGKTTGITRLKERYKEAFFMREPGGSPLAEEIRGILLSPVGGTMSPEQQMALFYAGRQINILKEVLPRRRAGIPVISDRFEASTFAYQKCMHYTEDRLVQNGPLYEKFASLHESVVATCAPTLYVYLKVDPKVGMERRAKARDQDSNHFDLAGLQEQSRRAASYHEFFKLVKKEKSSRVAVVDANQPLGEVVESVFAVVDRELGKSQNLFT